jgi:hypothetical protein
LFLPVALARLGLAFVFHPAFEAGHRRHRPAGLRLHASDSVRRQRADSAFMLLRRARLLPGVERDFPHRAVRQVHRVVPRQSLRRFFKRPGRPKINRRLLQS